MPKAKSKAETKKRKKPEETEEPEDKKSKRKKPAPKSIKKVEAKKATKAKKKEEPKKEEKKKGKGKKAKDQDQDKDDNKKQDTGDKKEEHKIVKGIKKGKAMVDAKVPNGSHYHVYESAGKVYAASLMWSDLKNNNNKYYLVQLLQEDANANSFMVWNRWGRVGADGQFAHFKFYDADSAIRTYQKKYNEKVGKGYTEIEISYDEEEKGEEKATKSKKEKKEDAECSLDDRVQKLIKLIFNMKLMQKQMVEIGYDAKKMPLGKLSKDTIKKGYEVLKKISDVLDGTEKGDLYDLSSDFFTVIPHDFGFK